MPLSHAAGQDEGLDRVPPENFRKLMVVLEQSVCLSRSMTLFSPDLVTVSHGLLPAYFL